jgi:hypothetical protein
MSEKLKGIQTMYIEPEYISFDKLDQNLPEQELEKNLSSVLAKLNHLLVEAAEVATHLPPVSRDSDDSGLQAEVVKSHEQVEEILRQHADSILKVDDIQKSLTYAVKRINTFVFSNHISPELQDQCKKFIQNATEKILLIQVTLSLYQVAYYQGPDVIGQGVALYEGSFAKTPDGKKTQFIPRAPEINFWRFVEAAAENAWEQETTPANASEYVASEFQDEQEPSFVRQISADPAGLANQQRLDNYVQEVGSKGEDALVAAEKEFTKLVDYLKLKSHRAIEQTVAEMVFTIRELGGCLNFKTLLMTVVVLAMVISYFNLPLMDQLNIVKVDAAAAQGPGDDKSLDELVFAKSNDLAILIGDVEQIWTQIADGNFNETMNELLTAANDLTNTDPAQVRDFARTLALDAYERLMDTAGIPSSLEEWEDSLPMYNEDGPNLDWIGLRFLSDDERELFGFPPDRSNEGSGDKTIDDGWQLEKLRDILEGDDEGGEQQNETIRGIASVHVDSATPLVQGLIGSGITGGGVNMEMNMAINIPGSEATIDPNALGYRQALLAANPYLQDSIRFLESKLHEARTNTDTETINYTIVTLVESNNGEYRIGVVIRLDEEVIFPGMGENGADLVLAAGSLIGYDNGQMCQIDASLMSEGDEVAAIALTADLINIFSTDPGFEGIDLASLEGTYILIIRGSDTTIKYVFVDGRLVRLGEGATNSNELVTELPAELDQLIETEFPYADDEIEGGVGTGVGTWGVYVISTEGYAENRGTLQQSETTIDFLLHVRADMAVRAAQQQGIELTYEQAIETLQSGGTFDFTGTVFAIPAGALGAVASGSGGLVEVPFNPNLPENGGNNVVILRMRAGFWEDMEGQWPNRLDSCRGLLTANNAGVQVAILSLSDGTILIVEYTHSVSGGGDGAAQNIATSVRGMFSDAPLSETEDRARFDYHNSEDMAALLNLGIWVGLPEGGTAADYDPATAIPWATPSAPASGQ